MEQLGTHRTIERVRAGNSAPKVRKSSASWKGCEVKRETLNPVISPEMLDDGKG